MVNANRFTAPTSLTEGRLSAHSPERLIFSVVFENEKMPITQRHPSQNIDEIGAILYDPSSLQVLMITTGVPKYKISGSQILCMLVYE